MKILQRNLNMSTFVVVTFITQWGKSASNFVAISSFFYSVALRPNAGHGLLILEVTRSHTTTHHSRYDSSGRVISSSQRPLPDNTQHSQQTNIHAPGGIRTHNLSRRAAADLRLIPRGHWDRRNILISGKIIKEMPGSVASGTPCIFSILSQSLKMAPRGRNT